MWSNKALGYLKYAIFEAPEFEKVGFYKLVYV